MLLMSPQVTTWTEWFRAVDRGMAGGDLGGATAFILSKWPTFALTYAVLLTVGWIALRGWRWRSKDYQKVVAGSAGISVGALAAGLGVYVSLRLMFGLYGNEEAICTSAGSCAFWFFAGLAVGVGGSGASLWAGYMAALRLSDHISNLQFTAAGWGVGGATVGLSSFVVTAAAFVVLGVILIVAAMVLLIVAAGVALAWMASAALGLAVWGAISND